MSDVIRITLFLRLIVILSDTLQTEECLFEYGNDLCNACQIPVIATDNSHRFKTTVARTIKSNSAVRFSVEKKYLRRNTSQRVFIFCNQLRVLRARHPLGGLNKVLKSKVILSDSIV